MDWCAIGLDRSNDGNTVHRVDQSKAQCMRGSKPGNGDDLGGEVCRRDFCCRRPLAGALGWRFGPSSFDHTRTPVVAFWLLGRPPRGEARSPLHKSRHRLLGTPSDTQPNPFGSEESIESKKDPTRGCWRPDLLGHRGRLKLLQASLELDAAGGRWPEAARAKQWPSTCRDFKQTRGDPVRGWQGPHTEPSRRLWAENL